MTTTRFAPAVETTDVAVQDEFIQWLTFANAGMLNRGNPHCMEYAISRLPTDDPIVEIGTFAGLSANVMTYFLRKHDRPNRLITCDEWGFEGAEPGAMIGNVPIRSEDYRTFVRESFLRNARFFSGDRLPFTVEMMSEAFFIAWRASQEVNDVFGRRVRLGGPISFAYIDGAHTRDAVRRDFEAVDACLVPGGFILFDDSADGSGWEVCDVVAEVATSGRYEVVLKNPNYLFARV
jgi:hypothetical protein